jgi:hypothetical protein
MKWGQDEEPRECCSCQEIKSCEWIADPYINEIEDRQECDWWCEDCFDTRAGDI